MSRMGRARRIILTKKKTMKYNKLPIGVVAVIERPWTVIIILLAVSIGLASGVTRLKFSDDIRVFFSKDNPQLRAYEALENTYSKSSSVLFVVSPKDGEIFTRETLGSVETLTREAWEIPHSRRVDSLSNFQYTHAVGDDLVVEDLVKNAARLSEEDIERIRSVALAEPLLVNRQISSQGHVAGINVTVNLPGIDPLKEQPETVNAARALVKRIESENPNLRVYLTGLIMINNALAEVGKSDLGTLIPLMLVVILVSLALLLRNFSGVAATFAVIILSIAAAMGAAGWLGIVLSPPVLSAANIIMTVAIADAVHILVTLLQNMRTGMDKKNALIESLKVNFQPVALTTATTILGFLSMNASESPPFRDLGNIVAMGVAAAGILALYLLPAVMMVLPVKASGKQGSGGGLMDDLASFVVKRRKGLSVGMTVVVIGLSLFVTQNKLNDEFLKYFDESLTFRKATDFTIDNLTGFEFFEYSIESGEPGGIHEPEFLKAADAFANWYREQPEVRHVYTFTDIMKRLNKNMNGDNAEWYRLPENRELAAQFLLLYEMSLPFGLDMTDNINIDKSAARMKVSLSNISSNGMLELERRAQDWLKANAPANMRNEGSGQSLMFAHIGQRNIRGMLGGAVIALILISFALIFALRSFKLGVLSLIPNLAPAAMAFGLWGFFVGEVGLALSVVVGMTLGIVVDDTIHFMSKYLYARREQGLSPEDSVRYSFAHVGAALSVTSVALIAGFFVLMASDFELNSSMGLLSAVTIAMALIADFLLLPPLIMAMEGKKYARN